ncbi:MAG: hypothetical protein M3P99_01195 [Pseudomonadota bacterium]|nr:hypothetical protein [Pseudomonadota bacterium]
MPWHAVETIPIRVGARISPVRARAISDALLQRAVPLSLFKDGRAEPLATAALVRDGDRVGLLTAAHIFEHAREGDIAVALPRDGRTVRLRSVRVHVVSHQVNDVAIVWIANPLAYRLCENWQVSSIPNESVQRSGDACSYVLAGYPACNARRVNGRVYVKPLVLFTGAIDADRYAYSRTAERIDGVTIWSPELDGVSGAMLWHITDDVADEVACILRPAALQVAFSHSTHLRGEPIACVVDLINRRR